MGASSGDGHPTITEGPEPDVTEPGSSVQPPAAAVTPAITPGWCVACRRGDMGDESGPRGRPPGILRTRPAEPDAVEGAFNSNRSTAGLRRGDRRGDRGPDDPARRRAGRVHRPAHGAVHRDLRHLRDRPGHGRHRHPLVHLRRAGHPRNDPDRRSRGHVDRDPARHGHRPQAQRTRQRAHRRGVTLDRAPQSRPGPRRRPGSSP